MSDSIKYLFSSCINIQGEKVYTLIFKVLIRLWGVVWLENRKWNYDCGFDKWYGFDIKYSICII